MTEKTVDREAIRHLIAEEAAYWDTTDTSQMMGTEPREKIEWTARDDRCDRCGAGMEHRQIDLHLADGRVTLHHVTWYVCRTPKCGYTKLPPGVETLITEIEAAVARALTSTTEPELAEAAKT